MEYALECAKRKQKFNGTIETPFIIGAMIELGNCLNLLEPNSLSIIRKAFLGLKELCEQSGVQMPVNKGANRALDCSVIQFLHESNKKSHIKPYDSIRSAFMEGGLVYPNSNFTDKLHIEICVLNKKLIKGYFLPLPVKEFNPYINKNYKPSL